MMRAAGCYRADEVYYTGNRFELARRFATDTKQMVEKILLGVDDLMEMVPVGCTPVLVDLIEGPLPAGLCAPGARLLHLRPGGRYPGSRPLQGGAGGDLRPDARLHESRRFGQRDPL